MFTKAQEKLIEMFTKDTMKRLDRFMHRVRGEGWRVLAGKDAEIYADKRHGHKYG